METWRTVDGFPDYEVSSLGRMRSWKPKGRWVGRPKAARIIGPNMHVKTGYVYACLCRVGAREYRYVHHLVLEAFVGPCPDGMECAHKNGVRNDNRLSNLRWDTPAGNAADKLVHGTSNQGSRHPLAKLNEEKVAAILAETGTSVAVARKYGVSDGTINAVRARKTWKHVGT